MHSLSVASGVAIARLLPHPTSARAGQAATLVERARLGLMLGPSELTAALMFAQPLVKAWPEHWWFAYLIGLDLGMKYLHDGFFINDIRRFVTEEFAEDPARSFEPRHPERARVCVLNEFDDDAGVHVLVVSRTETEQDLCEAALTANPEAIVSTCNSLQAAVELMKQCYHDGTQINLICIDAELLQPHNYDTDESAARKIVATSQSFCQQIEPRDVRNFACKPPVVAISTAVCEVMFSFQSKGEAVCDFVIPAHLASNLLRILMEISEL
ncbi:hypothetical protein AB1Y20_014628 [Prymnesium parvum]|uniref:Uncharacterized protein n=1 Tax=Prymnesium parvum TaxID=97485 RepID=A0AB34IB58_PRYPA